MSPKGVRKQLGVVAGKLFDALSQRYQRALGVIDEALDSDSLKDKIWAVDQIFKRTLPEKSSGASSVELPHTTPPAKDPATMSETELMAEIQGLLGWQPHHSGAESDDSAD
jgi:hypothetical protein